MPYVTSSDGVRIFYTTMGQGEPLVLVHGATHTWESWQDLGYVDGLKDRFQLVLMDLRGHGRSDKPHDAVAYASPRHIDDVIAVLDDLGIESTHFWGFSYGARIGFHLGVHRSDRLRSLILHGFQPYPHRATPEVLAWINGLIETLQRGMDAWVADLDANGILDQYPSPQARRERLVSADAEALIASMRALRDDPGVAHRLATLSMPSLVIVRQNGPYNDTAPQAAKEMSLADFVSVAGIAHTMVRAQIILPYVRAFLERCGLLSRADRRMVIETAERGRHDHDPAGATR